MNYLGSPETKIERTALNLRHTGDIVFSVTLQHCNASVIRCKVENLPHI